MVDPILPTRIVRDRPGTQLVRYRPPYASVVAVSAGGGLRRGDPLAIAPCESPWSGARIEERYGALGSARRYGPRKTPVCGLLVDLFV